MHVGVGPESIEPAGPRDELGRAAGLTIAEHDSILTDLSCRSSDPDIYAIGEVAAIEGRCYGLVGRCRSI